MSYPKNPETIILKNSIYSRGLTESDVWNYYQKVKSVILQETKNRDLMFIIMVDLNKPIIRRRTGAGFIRLNSTNYDEVITGRTLSIHSAMGLYEDFGIIDIDIDPSDGFKWAKVVTKETYEFVMDKIPIIESASIRYTGKTSFHIHCNFRRKMKIDTIRFLLRKFLQESDLAKKYTIEGRRRPGIPNLDMAPNKFRGNFIVLNSLSELGLMCVEVPYQSLMRFEPRQARI
jgi:DNA primase